MKFPFFRASVLEIALKARNKTPSVLEKHGTRIARQPASLGVKIDILEILSARPFCAFFA
jgi:hypothetical protein